LAEDVITTAAFGQNKNSDKEEEPIIIAQRFLNIFRQLHIFTKEKKEEFDELLLKQPKAVRKSLKTLPGGSVLLEYMDELEHGSDNQDDDTADSSDVSIVETASQEIATSQPTSTVVTAGAPIIDSDNFAKVLASSLAQSNAQIIKELRNSPNVKNSTAGAVAEQLKLVADDTFTRTISNALAEAISASEQKRLEDNKLIAQSFLDLQDNLNKMIEQNNQIKIISNSDAPAEAAAAFQVKNIIDDLVKAQSKFLKETTQSQKEELSALISLAIKDSIKLSTQTLIDSFKQMEENGPTPITYAASSPKKQQAMLENVTEALKAQGREFSSIIAATLKESQQNSAQTIIQTIEKLKGMPVSSDNTRPKVEEIMKAQADLFREITHSQSQEFSAIITAALKESQQQSTNAIIAALSQMKNVPAGLEKISEAVIPSVESIDSGADVSKDSDTVSLVHETGISPDKDYSVVEDVATADAETSKKKKKKKKKKNREEQIVIPPVTKVAEDDETPILEKPLQKKKTIISALPELPVIEDKPIDSASDWGFGSTTSSSSVDSNLAPVKNEAESQLDTTEQESANEGDGWTWKYQPEDAEGETVSGQEGQDWEWEYEEVPEEESVGEELSGTEGQDWEWEYEEVPDDEQVATAEVLQESVVPEQIVQSSEIVVPRDFEIILAGIDDDAEKDPYFDTVNSVG